jgi:PAS domain S-box-containing protein
MMVRRTSLNHIWRRVALIIVPSLALVMLETYSALSILPDEGKSNARISRTFEIMLTARALDQALQDAERSERDFLIMGEGTYLASYGRAREDISAHLATLEQLTSDNAEQQHRLSLLAEQIDALRADLERATAARQEQGLDAARAVLATNTGREAMHMAKGLIGLIVSAERTLLRDEEAQASEARRHSLIAAAAASALAAAIMVLGSILLVIALVRGARAQGRLRESEERFTLLVESVKDYAIFMLDSAGYVRSWNTGAQRITGYRPDEIIGKHFSCFFPADDVGEGTPARELATVAAEGRAETEGWRLRKDGVRYWANIVTTAVHDESGNLRGFAKVARDLTERRQQEQALELSRAALAQAQKMEAVGQLTGGVAHDFNNLLTTILGSHDLLQRRMDQIGRAETQRYLAAIGRAAEQGAALTRRLLAFSRRQALEPTLVDANQLVTGVAELLRCTLGEAIGIEVVSAADLWCTEVDRNQLESAILNLAINARDAMAEGGKLTIETGNVCLDDAYAGAHDEVKAGQYVMVAVSDTGLGMSPETMARAFEPFFTTKPEGRGTGLGLSQIYGFVKQSGGHVKLYSESGQGTTVKMYLPRSHSAGAARFVAPPAGTPAAAGAGGATLLVVEDDPDVRSFSISALGLLGYQVLDAADGAQALRILGEHPEVALLFTDVGLPGLNGCRLAEEAQQLVPGLRVLFTTGYARNAVIHSGVLEATVNLLPKPFTVERLGRKLEEVLGAA